MKSPDFLLQVKYCFCRTLLVANGEIHGASHLFTPSVGGATLRSAYQAIMKAHLSTIRQQRQQLQNLIICAQDNLCVNYFLLLNGRFSTAEELHYRIVSLSLFFFIFYRNQLTLKTHMFRLNAVRLNSTVICCEKVPYK